MSGFVEKPNLPRRAVGVIIGEYYSEYLSEWLNKAGIFQILLPNNPWVDHRLTGHADLSALHLGGEGICLAPYLRDSSFSSNLSSLGACITYADILQSSTYPGDAQLNLCIAGDKLFYNPRSSDLSLINYLTIHRGLKAVLSRQGYARCSICVVTDNALITADPGLYAAAQEQGCDVLLITPGFVKLDGFDYGFIGGTSFKLDENRLAFTGNLDMHPDKERIISFLYQHEVDPVYITELPIFDIGSAIPIIEA